MHLQYRGQLTQVPIYTHRQRSNGLGSLSIYMYVFK
jgi:ribosomal protein L30E